MKSLWRIITTTRSLWKFYITVSVISVLVAATSQVQPLLIKGVVDEATGLVAGGTVDMRLVVLCIGGMFLADVSQTLLSNLGGYIGDVLQQRLRKSLSEQYFAHLLKLPQRYFDREVTGTILNRLNRSVDHLTFYTHAMSNNVLQLIFSTILSLIIIYIFSWPVGVMLTLLYPTYILLTVRTTKKWQTYQKKINTQVDRGVGRFTEAISQMKVVKSFGRETNELRHLQKRYGRAVDLTRPQSRLWHRQDILRRLAMNVIFLGVITYLFWQMTSGAYTIGTAVLLLQYAISIRMPLFSISFIIDNSQRAIANSRDYFEAMDELTEVADDGGKKVKLRGESVRFTNVDFGYIKDEKVLKNVSFEMKKGTKTALVGESGEGKTTITNLLLGFYSPDKGMIEIDGYDTRDLSRASIRSAIAVVFQDPALFSGTIRENIAYGRPNATRDEVEAAARAANAHEFIEAFKKGYDTEIGERGIKLSGGQKQRIAIARAILKDAPILVLDEATSSLDSRSEHLVQEALERLMHGRLTLIIAHRLSTIQSVGTIVTLKGGKVDEIGSPESLAESQGIYAQLLALQERHTKDSRARLKTYEFETE